MMNQFHSSWKKVIGTCAVVMGCALLLVHSEKMNSQSNLKGTVDSNLPELGGDVSVGKWPWPTCKMDLDLFYVKGLSDSGSEVEIRLFIGNGNTWWDSGGHCSTCHIFHLDEDSDRVYGPNGIQQYDSSMTADDHTAMKRMQGMEIRNDQPLILYTQELDGSSGNDWNQIHVNNPCDQLVTEANSSMDGFGKIKLKRSAGFEGGTIGWVFTASDALRSKAWCDRNKESYYAHRCPW
mmetsp:Transcript_21746/g.30667  ORF Transcript_21746/g.30667 Transcript_21746/m.30667 type:complete len:236 (-) Transcript_21746:127-834(-)